MRIMDFIEETSNQGKRLIGLARLKKSSNAKFSIEEIKMLNF